MDPEEARQEQIDQYLLGQSDPAERSAFEQRLERDPLLRQQLEDTESAMAAIELFEDDALKNRLRQLDAQFQGNARPLTTAEEPPDATAPSATEAKVVTMRPLKRSRRTLLAYAATLILLLGAVYWLIQPGDPLSPQQLALNTFEPYDNIAYTFQRGEADETAEAAAFRAYEAGDFDKAAYTFLRLEQTPVRPQKRIGRLIKVTVRSTKLYRRGRTLRGIVQYGLPPAGRKPVLLGAYGGGIRECCGRQTATEEFLTRLSRQRLSPRG